MEWLQGNGKREVPMEWMGMRESKGMQYKVAALILKKKKNDRMYYGAVWMVFSGVHTYEPRNAACLLVVRILALLTQCWQARSFTLVLFL